ncbi:hypothetical protein DFO55_12425 [Grimontella sp. AG753]|nr:hypothetical protein DFO55_12425 [Grimontella sp. AG753]
MKANRLAVALLVIIGSQMLGNTAFADRIIQRQSGAFYIVSDQEAAMAFDRNNFGFFVLPPSVNTPPYTGVVNKAAKKRAYKSKPVKAPVNCTQAKCPSTPAKPSHVKPVTTVESADSIFLRLEKKK